MILNRIMYHDLLNFGQLIIEFLNLIISFILNVYYTNCNIPKELKLFLNYTFFYKKRKKKKEKRKRKKVKYFLVPLFTLFYFFLSKFSKQSNLVPHE